MLQELKVSLHTKGTCPARSLIHFIVCACSDFVPEKGPCYISFDSGTCLCHGSLNVQGALILSGKNEPEESEPAS